MTKTELMENHTAEQLAEMVEKLDNENTGLKKEILKKTGLCGEAKVSFEFNGPECRCGGYDIAVKKNKELQSEVEKYRKAFEYAKKEHECQVAEYQKKIEDLEHDLKISREKIQDLASVNMNLQCERNDYKSKAETLEIESRRIDTNKSELERAKNTINQIDDILERLFGVRHDIGKPDEFEKILKQKAESYNTIAYYLCDEPISVAQTLISEKRGYELSEEEKQRSGLEKGYYHIFDISELRQIAEHLLVYCNHNGEVEE